MITGAHSIIYSSDAAADTEFFKNILKLGHVDAGRGWLIFGLPPSEIAFHPSAENGESEFYLMCDDIHQFIEKMTMQNVSCSPVESMRWGNLTYLTLPGGGKLGVYEPKHARP
ncbi:MAG: extradiol dioxygenase [Bacteroidota bacterium]